MITGISVAELAAALARSPPRVDWALSGTATSVAAIRVIKRYEHCITNLLTKLRPLKRGLHYLLVKDSASNGLLCNCKI
jgi:hypothetical protein